MSAPLDVVDENELAFFFLTNEPVPARPFLTFIAEVERIAQTQRHLGPFALVEVSEVITGTKHLRLTFGQKIQKQTVLIAAGTLALGVANLGLDIAGRLKRPTGRLPESVAEMCLDNGVVECVVTTSKQRIHITREDMPALNTVERKRAATGLTGIPKATLHINDAISSSEIAAESPILRAEHLGGFERLEPGSDDRVYTVVGHLSPPGTPSNRVRSNEGQFRSESGRIYVAQGVDWEKLPRDRRDPLVIRARTIGQTGEFRLLSVIDVFEPEEP